MSVKQGIHECHRSESINMIAKYIVNMHSSVELKAYQLSHIHCLAALRRLYNLVSRCFVLSGIVLQSSGSNCIMLMF